MAIEISQNKVVSHHWLVFKTAEQYRGKDLYFFSVSGVALSNLKGNSGNWRREDLVLNIKIPTDRIPVPPKPVGNYFPNFKSKHWTVYAGLNAAYNRGHAINSGHAVDTFKLLNPWNISNNLRVQCRTAVSDTDAYLYRIGFKVDLLLYFNKHIEVVID